MRSEGRFMDILLDGDIYQACKVDAFIPRIGYVSIVMDAKATTKDVHLLCTDLKDSSLEEIIRHAVHRHRIDEFYRETKALGLGEYRIG
jgi:hypothetical protein